MRIDQMIDVIENELDNVEKYVNQLYLLVFSDDVYTVFKLARKIIDTPPANKKLLAIANRMLIIAKQLSSDEYRANLDDEINGHLNGLVSAVKLLERNSFLLTHTLYMYKNHTAEELEAEDLFAVGVMVDEIEKAYYEISNRIYLLRQTDLALILNAMKFIMFGGK